MADTHMIQTFFGKKLGQTGVFTEEGTRIPVTDILVEPAVVVQVKTKDKDQYQAIQLGIGSSRQKKSNAYKGHVKKTGKEEVPNFLREVKIEEIKDTKVGDVVKIDQIFTVGDKVKITGISKSKGFAGVVKRHGFAGGPRTHGQSDRERAPGSIGQTTTPGRVYKGKRMAGRMGGEKVTVRGLKVIAIDSEKNMIRIKGLIPGRVNTYVTLSKQ